MVVPVKRCRNCLSVFPYCPVGYRYVVPVKVSARRAAQWAFIWLLSLHSETENI